MDLETTLDWVDYQGSELARDRLNEDTILYDLRRTYISSTWISARWAAGDLLGIPGPELQRKTRTTWKRFLLEKMRGYYIDSDVFRMDNYGKVEYVRDACTLFKLSGSPEIEELILEIYNCSGIRESRILAGETLDRPKLCIWGNEHKRLLTTLPFYLGIFSLAFISAHYAPDIMKWLFE